MTTWAVQPTDYGNEVKIWADVFDGSLFDDAKRHAERQAEQLGRPITIWKVGSCLLYTSPSPRDRQKSRMPSSA